MGNILPFRQRTPKPQRDDIAALLAAFHTASSDLQRAVANDAFSRQLAAEEALKDISRTFRWPEAVRAELRLCLEAISQWDAALAQTQILRSLELLESWALTCPEILCGG